MMELNTNDSRLSQFILKLRTFVTNVPANVGAWNENGTVYQIKGHLFETEYLPAYFNCSRPSFIRQLHLYGFQKQANDGDCWSFSHVKFRRDSLHLMNEIKRKKQKRMKAEASSTSKDGVTLEYLSSELRCMQERVASLEKCVEQLNQRDCNLGTLVGSNTGVNFETVVNTVDKAEVGSMPMPLEYHEEFSGEIATVVFVSAESSIKTTIGIFGKFLEYFVTECQKPIPNIETILNIQLPIGHPFKALLAHCSSDAMRAVLARVLSYPDLVSLIGICEPSLLIEILPSRRDFFNAIMIRAMSVSGNIISQATGGIFSHYLSLLMRASISKRTNTRPVDVSKSPMLSGVLLLVHRDAMDPIICARNELQDYNNLTTRYHDQIDKEWICL